MKKEELKLITYISITLSTILGVAFLVCQDHNFDLKNGPRALSFGITCTTFFWAFYYTCGWKLPVLDKIFYRPNLNGTWGGILKSDYTDENGNTKDDIKFYIVIRQSFLRIHFTTFTDSFIGTSYSETLSLKKEIGLKNVAYLYRKETSQEDDNFLQEGATELRLVMAETKRLEGKYWSNRKTNGKISVSFISENKVDSFIDAQKLKCNE